MAITLSAMVEKMNAITNKRSAELIKIIDEKLMDPVYLDSSGAIDSYAMGFFLVEVDGVHPQGILDEVTRQYTNSANWKAVHFTQCTRSEGNAKYTQVRLFVNEVPKENTLVKR